jgi:Protein of unknown function (DUF3540)
MQTIDNSTSVFTQAIVQKIGEVEQTRAEAVTISTPGGIRKAQLALSCLMQPVAGDTVLIAVHGDSAYVLSVLARACEAPIVLRLARSTELAVDGDLRLNANLIGIQAPAIEMSADTLTLLSRAARWMSDTLDTTAKRINQISETFNLHARGYQRHIEDMELARVGHMDLRAKEVLNMHARHAMLKSTELVKIDGKQIQVG